MSEINSPIALPRIDALLTGVPDRGNLVNFTVVGEVLMGSIVKKRRKKMRKHKHKKLRAKQRHKNK